MSLRALFAFVMPTYRDNVAAGGTCALIRRGIGVWHCQSCKGLWHLRPQGSKVGLAAGAKKRSLQGMYCYMSQLWCSTIRSPRRSRWNTKKHGEQNSKSQILLPNLVAQLLTQRVQFMCQLGTVTMGHTQLIQQLGMVNRWQHQRPHQLRLDNTRPHQVLHQLGRIRHWLTPPILVSYQHYQRCPHLHTEQWCKIICFIWRGILLVLWRRTLGAEPTLMVQGLRSCISHKSRSRTFLQRQHNLWCCKSRMKLTIVLKGQIFHILVWVVDRSDCGGCANTLKTQTQISNTPTTQRAAETTAATTAETCCIMFEDNSWWGMVNSNEESNGDTAEVTCKSWGEVVSKHVGVPHYAVGLWLPLPS